MPRSPFWIGDPPGYRRGIGNLVDMLAYARRTTLQAVQGLSVGQLDHLHDARANSIGMLLAHIAAVEFAYQLDTFESREPSADELKRFGAALDLGDAARKAIHGRPLQSYLDQLSRVRQSTLDRLAVRSDDWLDQSTPFWQGQPANNYFKWFHVMEDELSHRGQIRWLRARLPDPTAV